MSGTDDDIQDGDALGPDNGILDVDDESGSLREVEL